MGGMVGVRDTGPVGRAGYRPDMGPGMGKHYRAGTGWGARYRLGMENYRVGIGGGVSTDQKWEWLWVKYMFGLMTSV